MPEKYQSWERQRRDFTEWALYLARFPWEWHATFTFEDGARFPVCQRQFKRWRFALIDEEKIQVGGYWIACTKRSRNLHFHVLLVGRNRFGKTLADCSRRQWEAAFPHHARISNVTDTADAVVYWARHLFGWRCIKADYDSFGVQLLKRVMVRLGDGYDGHDGFDCDDGPTIGAED